MHVVACAMVVIEWISTKPAIDADSVTASLFTTIKSYGLGSGLVRIKGQALTMIT